MDSPHPPESRAHYLMQLTMSEIPGTQTGSTLAQRLQHIHEP